MQLGLGWKLHGDGSTPRAGEVVRPDERLSWGRTVGLGAQHIVAMFGATFVFPLIMGLSPQLAIMMSGVATILFLLLVQGKVPSYLGTSASFVGGVAAIREQGGTSQEVTGAILVAGVVLALVGLVIHFLGARVIFAVLPPVVTGAVVMLIGFNLAPVVATVYWPQDQWVALIVMFTVIVMSLALRGFLGRISIFLGPGVRLRAVVRVRPRLRQITSFDPGAGEVTTRDRVNWDGVRSADWFGFPPETARRARRRGAHRLALPRVPRRLRAARPAGRHRAHRRERRARQGGGRDDRRRPRPGDGRALAADGVATVVTSSVGGSPTTTYAENIGVMAATRVYSTAAYYVAGGRSRSCSACRRSSAR
jgi:xanthine/uracil permease